MDLNLRIRKDEHEAIQFYTEDGKRIENVIKGSKVEMVAGASNPGMIITLKLHQRELLTQQEGQHEHE